VFERERDRSATKLTPQSRVAVTGTREPASRPRRHCSLTKYDVIHLNDRIKGTTTSGPERDADRDTLVADLDAVREHLGDWSGVLDSPPRAPVRRRPRGRPPVSPGDDRAAARKRGESDATAEENAEKRGARRDPSEAVAEHGMDNVYGIDTTDRDPESVADAIRAAIEGDPRAEARDRRLHGLYGPPRPSDR